MGIIAVEKSKWNIVQKIFSIVLFSAVIEVWDFQSGEGEIIEPTLQMQLSAAGIAIFEVDAYFCNIWFNAPPVLK